MRHHNFSQQAANFARDAERQFAQINRAIRALRDKDTGLRRSLHVPVPHGGRRYTRSTRSSPSFFLKAGENALGNVFARDLVGEFGLGSGSFYASAAQISSVWMDSAEQAQRIS